MELIQTITHASVNEFDFNSIPGVYNRLHLYGRLRSDEVSTTYTVQLFFNADTTEANYHRQGIRGINGAASATESAQPIIITVPNSTSPANAYGSFHIVLESYADTSVLKSAYSEFESYRGSGDMDVGSFGMTNTSMTAAITRLRLRSQNHASKGIMGVVRLYGES